MGISIEKRDALVAAYKLGCISGKRRSWTCVSDSWVAMIAGLSEHEVMDLHAAMVYGQCGDSFAAFMAQRFPEGVQA